MTKAIAKKKTAEMTFPRAALVASFKRDFQNLTEDQRIQYVYAVCKALKIPTPLNPFYFIPTKKGGLILYASSEAAQLIANRNNITCQIIGRVTDTASGLHTVCVRATMRNGRTHENIGVVDINGKTGENLANTLMKCVTKAMRRTVLSAVGLSISDAPPDMQTPTTMPEPPPLPIIEAKNPEPTNEANELKDELFNLLVSKKGMFPGRPKDASDWISKESGKEFCDLTAVESEELIAKINSNQKEGDDDGEDQVPWAKGKNGKGKVKAPSVAVIDPSEQSTLLDEKQPQAVESKKQGRKNQNSDDHEQKS